MAETSGFFDAVLNAGTGEYDLEYTAKQFADYFSLFIKNGVFGSPTNQLKISAGTGLKVTVSAGWAFINGQWYHNDAVKELVIPPNATSQIRTDSVKCRLNVSTRKIEVLYFNGDVTITRDGSYYDLKLAEIIIPVAATQVTNSNITDTRMNENVCGMVTELLRVQTTNDLFSQYNAAFNTWFNEMKDQLSTDAAGNLQTEINEIQDNLFDTVNKNLIPFPYYDSTKVINDVTFTVNVDGSITANGTATQDTLFWCISRVYTNVMYDIGTYKLNGCPAGGSATTFGMVMNYTDSQNVARNYGNDTGSGLNITITNATKGLNGIGIFVKSGKTVNNKVFKPMLIKGNQAIPYSKNFRTTRELSDSIFSLGTKTIPSGSSTYTITDSRINDSSMVDVYFSDASKSVAKNAGANCLHSGDTITINFENPIESAITIANVKVVNL